MCLTPKLLKNFNQSLGYQIIRESARNFNLCSRPTNAHRCNIFLFVCLFVCLFLELQLLVGQSLLIREVSRSHTTTHYSRQDSSGRVISLSQGTLPNNIQHSQQTNIHDPGGIRNHHFRRRAAADPRVSPRRHSGVKYVYQILFIIYLFQSLLRS